MSMSIMYVTWYVNVWDIELTFMNFLLVSVLKMLNLPLRLLRQLIGLNQKGLDLLLVVNLLLLVVKLQLLQHLNKRRD